MNYAIALNELGSEVVHDYIGQEPSGRKFNDLDLDYNSEFNRNYNLCSNKGLYPPASKGLRYELFLIKLINNSYIYSFIATYQSVAAFCNIPVCCSLLQCFGMLQYVATAATYQSVATYNSVARDILRMTLSWAYASFICISS